MCLYGDTLYYQSGQSSFNQHMAFVSIINFISVIVQTLNIEQEKFGLYYQLKIDR